MRLDMQLAPQCLCGSDVQLQWFFFLPLLPSQEPGSVSWHSNIRDALCPRLQMYLSSSFILRKVTFSFSSCVWLPFSLEIQSVCSKLCKFLETLRFHYLSNSGPRKGQCLREIIYLMCVSHLVHPTRLCTHTHGLSLFVVHHQCGLIRAIPSQLLGLPNLLDHSILDVKGAERPPFLLIRRALPLLSTDWYSKKTETPRAEDLAQAHIGPVVLNYDCTLEGKLA